MYKKTFKTFIAFALLTGGLASSALAEVQPFFTMKVASINMLANSAEKIAAMAGVAETPEFREGIALAKSLQGFNFDGFAGVAFTVDDAQAIGTVVLLPITDITKAEIPSHPEIFASVYPFLVKKAEGRYDINSPLGTFVALQKRGYLVIASESVADQLPADPRTLFADLDKFTFGIKTDLEKIEFSTIEANLFGPMLMMMMIQDPNAGEQLESIVELYRELYKEMSGGTFGFTFNPRTADTEVFYSLSFRKGSNLQKAFADYKVQPTRFSGFRGTPQNIVFSTGESCTFGKFELSDAMKELNAGQWEMMLEGLMEQIALEDETGEMTERVKKVVASVQKITEDEQNRGAYDYAFSYATDGTLMGAFETVSLEEIRNLASMLADFARQLDDAQGGLIRTIISENLNREYTTVANFKVSSVKLPLSDLMEKAMGPAPGDELDDLTIAVFWAAQDGNKQAIAAAVGLDYAKTEQTFKAALEKTATAAPAQKPMGVFSLQGLGKYLQQTIEPIIAKTDEDAELLPSFKKVSGILASSGNDAVTTLDSTVKADRQEITLRVAGTLIQTVITAVKAAVEDMPAGMLPGIQDF